MEIKKIVEKVLSEDPIARNNDFVLVIKVYIELGYARRIPTGVVIEYLNIEDAPAFETITRIRREIQNEEKRFMATEEVRDKRERHRIDIQEKYGGKGVRAETSPNSWMMP